MWQRYLEQMGYFLMLLTLKVTRKASTSGEGLLQ